MHQLSEGTSKGLAFFFYDRSASCSDFGVFVGHTFALRVYLLCSLLFGFDFCLKKEKENGRL